MYILVISKYGLGERASSLINRKVVFENKRPLLHSDGKEIFKFQVDLEQEDLFHTPKRVFSRLFLRCIPSQTETVGHWSAVEETRWCQVLKHSSQFQEPIP